MPIKVKYSIRFKLKLFKSNLKMLLITDNKRVSSFKGKSKICLKRVVFLS